jgi:hypothetical protein
MFNDSWSLYDTPRHPRKWIFHPRKRSWLPQIISGFAILGLVVLTAFGGS